MESTRRMFFTSQSLEKSNSEQDSVYSVQNSLFLVIISISWVVRRMIDKYCLIDPQVIVLSVRDYHYL